MSEKIKTRSDAQIKIDHQPFTCADGKIMECDDIRIDLPNGCTVKIDTHTANGQTWTRVWLFAEHGALAGSAYVGAGIDISDLQNRQEG